MGRIHKSKNSFCSYVDPDYHQFDIILPSIEKINIGGTIARKQERGAKRMTKRRLGQRKLEDEVNKTSDWNRFGRIGKNDLIFGVGRPYTGLGS